MPAAKDKEPMLWFHGAWLVLVCAVSLHQKIGATDPPLFSSMKWQLASYLIQPPKGTIKINKSKKQKLK